MVRFKKKVFIITGCILAVLCQVDEVNGQGTRWGISGAISFHRFDYVDPLPWWEESSQSFPAIGVYMEWPMHFIEGPLGNILRFNTGLRYARLASKVDFALVLGDEDQEFTGAFRINQHYLLLPAQLELFLGRAPVYLMAGPEVGFLLTAGRISETFTPEEFRDRRSQTISRDLKRVSVFLYGGAGVRLSKRLSTFVRFGSALGRALKEGERSFVDNDWTSKELSAGLKLDLGG